MAIIEAFHGTNQEFDRFEARFLGLNTGSGSSREAFFFAMREDTAHAYADFAARNLIPNQERHQARIEDLLTRISAAEARGNWTLSEALTLEMEDLEFGAIQAEAAGGRVLRCAIEISTPLVLEGDDPLIQRDFGAVLATARANGHDAVIVHGMNDTPNGVPDPDTHIAIFNAAAIEIREVLLIEGDCAPGPF